AVEGLQAEMEALEADNRRMRQAAAQAVKPAEAAAAAGAAVGPLSAVPNDLLGLRAKVATLLESAAFLHRDNALLRARHVFSDDARSLRASLLSCRPRPVAASLGDVGDAVREARVVAKEAYRLAAAPRLVRLAPAAAGSDAGSAADADPGAMEVCTPAAAAGGTVPMPVPVQKPAWQPLRERPQFDLYRQQTLALSLKQRAESVQDRLRSLAVIRLPSFSPAVV
ncbi:hypothetical protein GGF37_006503, partial [Kickxella alabastrina]